MSAFDTLPSLHSSCDPNGIPILYLGPGGAART